MALAMLWAVVLSMQMKSMEASLTCGSAPLTSTNLMHCREITSSFAWRSVTSSAIMLKYLTCLSGSRMGVRSWCALMSMSSFVTVFEVYFWFFLPIARCSARMGSDLTWYEQGEPEIHNTDWHWGQHSCHLCGLPVVYPLHTTGLHSLCCCFQDTFVLELICSAALCSNRLSTLQASGLLKACIERPLPCITASVWVLMVVVRVQIAIFFFALAEILPNWLHQGAKGTLFQSWRRAHSSGSSHHLEMESMTAMDTMDTLSARTPGRFCFSWWSYMRHTPWQPATCMVRWLWQSASEISAICPAASSRVSYWIAAVLGCSGSSDGQSRAVSCSRHADGSLGTRDRIRIIRAGRLVNIRPAVSVSERDTW